MEHDHFVSAAGLVWNDQGQILLVNSPLRGWEYPGGMIEAGETIQAGLLREIREESGVTAEIVAFAGVSKNLSRDIVNLDFICRYTGGELTTSPESTQVRWATPAEALALVTLPVTLERLRNMLSGRGEILCFNFRREPYQVSEAQRFPVDREPFDEPGMP